MGIRLPMHLLALWLEGEGLQRPRMCSAYPSDKPAVKPLGPDRVLVGPGRVLPDPGRVSPGPGRCYNFSLTKLCLEGSYSVT